MSKTDYDLYNSIMLQFSHAIKRNSTPAWKIPHQTIGFHNLLLVVDGEMTFFCNGKEYKAGKGDLVYFKPGDERGATTNPERLLKMFTVDFQIIGVSFEDCVWNTAEVALPFSPLSKIEDKYLYRRLTTLFDEFNNHWVSGQNNRIFRCRAAFMEILSLLYDYFQKSNINYGEVNSVEKAIGFIVEHYQQRLTLEDMAESVGFSPSYFGHIFKNVTGKTPIAFLIEYRIDRAKEFLKLGHTVTETSKKVGFHDIYYFSKCFKRIESISPAKYIKNQW